MRTMTILATAAALSVVTSALAEPVPTPDPAAVIPAEYRGEWCEHGPYYVRRSVEPCKRHSDEWVRITTTFYEGWETQCRLLKISKGTTHVGDFYADHVMTFYCDFDGDRQTARFSFGVSPGRESRGIRLYIENITDKDSGR
jgi:hypothetical protein